MVSYMVTIGSIDFDLPFLNSKKERRAILNHVIDKMKRSNISVIDNSGEYSHDAQILFTFIRHDSLSTNKTIKQIEQIIFERISDDCFEINFESF